MTNLKEGVNVVLPENYNGSPIEVVLREGVASKPLDPKEPIITDLSGSIETVGRWLEKRVDLINQKSSHILVNREMISITLFTDEQNHYRSKLKGSLQISNKFLEFGINTGKIWDHIKLSQFIKMDRAFFTSKESNMELVTTLKSFRAKINQNVEQSKEENGSKTDNFSQIVESNLPKAFKVSIPLFSGHQPEEIEVEIYADIDGRDVSLSLISAGAAELLEDYRNKVIDDQLSIIQGIAPDIVIIEQ
ncbi:hypothetical protein [Dysgonomonas capnocytophagoides]|uniref:hypothetical protein n=1 Tax=Dysgonomonas capnocytophagoides TaxID=45254 RepID=UPI00334236F6